MVCRNDLRQCLWSQLEQSQLVIDTGQCIHIRKKEAIIYHLLHQNNKRQDMIMF